MKQTIVHTENSLGWGGQEIRILKESCGMRARGHRVIIIAEEKSALFKRAKEEGFEVFSVVFSKTGALFSIYRLYTLFRQTKASIVNTHSSIDSWLGGIAAKMARIPVLRTRHISSPIRGGINSKLLYGYLADGVVTTTSSILGMICKQSGIDSRLCRCIPTGVDVEEMRKKQKEEEKASVRRRLGIADTDFVAGTLCVVRSWKGVEDLIQSAFLLKDQPMIKWLIIGGGYLEKHAAEIIKLGLEKTVIMTGHLDNPFPVLSVIDVFLLLSTKNEGISQASLQAAFLEKPLITTRIGGLPEVCLDGETGFTVDLQSPREVAERLLYIKENKELGAVLGKKGKELVMKKFTQNGMLDRMEEMYEAIEKR